MPSRLKYLTSPVKSLAGLRIAVKDKFQVQGIRTSLCNLAFYNLYPEAQENAGCVDILVRKGAIVVGTTKVASFTATEEPIEYVDFQAPWNPRADGYRSPAGSSSGSGSAIAAYPWIDLAIGSDSMCCSALIHVFGLIVFSQLVGVDDDLATGTAASQCGPHTECFQ